MNDQKQNDNPGQYNNQEQHSSPTLYNNQNQYNNYGQYGGRYDKPTIPNYLNWSIISIFLSPIFGFIALIFSLRVNKLVNSGNYQNAVNASNTAKIMDIIATAIGIISIIYIII